MPGQPRVGVFYSYGPHFRRALAAARARWPQAELVAVVPPNYPREVVRDDCDRIVTTPRSDYGARDVGALRALGAQLREERFTVFVTMFPSLKQRALAWGSGARERGCFGADGQWHPLPLAPVRGVAGAIGRRLRGELTYAWLWLVVRATRVR